MVHTALIVPGLAGSGPAHWQTVWEETRGDCARVAQRDWDDPDPDEWVATLHRAIWRAEPPVVLVAHSLGCLLVARWADAFRSDDHVLGALLVAPCDPECPRAPDTVARFGPLSARSLPFASTVVASRDDPYASFDRARRFADTWGSSFVDAGAAGHINANSGLGDWRFGQVLLDEIVARPASPDASARYRRAALLRDNTNSLSRPNRPN